MTRAPQFNEEQRAQVIKLIELPAWGDIVAALEVMEIALRRALEATAEHFNIDEEGEFDVTATEVASMSDERRLAYVARLLRTFALMYGVGTEYGNKILGADVEPNSPAGLLRGLNDIVMMPLTE